MKTAELDKIMATEGILSRIIVKRERMSDNRLYGIVSNVIVGLHSVFWQDGNWYEVVSIETRDQNEVILWLKPRYYDTTKPTVAKELNLSAIGLSLYYHSSVSNHRETLHEFLKRGGTILKCEPGVASGAVDMFNLDDMIPK